MAISVSCGKCGRRYSVKDELAGKRIRCKECETIIAIPTRDEDDPFGGVDLRSSGRAVDTEEEDDDDDGEALPVRRKKVPTKSRQRRKWRPDDGMPIGVILAISAVVVLMALNGLGIAMGMMSPDFAALLKQRPWQFIGPAVRILIEARVIWGLTQRMSSTRIAATIMAILVTLIIAGLWLLILQVNLPGRNMQDPEEAFVLALVLGIQICCELVVIVGLNLMTSRQYLSE